MSDTPKPPPVRMHYIESPTLEHPTIRQLTLQAAQLEELAEQCPPYLQPIVLNAYRMTTVIAALGVEPAKWGNVAEELVHGNVSLMTRLVEMGAPMPNVTKEPTDG